MTPGKLHSASDGSGYGKDNRASLEDRRRPSLPYLNGQTLSIKRHIPPQPFGLGYYKGSEPRPKIRDSKIGVEVTDVEWCIRHPPADTPSHPDQRTRQLQILDPVVRRDGHGAQIVRCKLDGKGPCLVAKVYDALYYPLDDGDLTWLADEDYSCEAAAYEDLQKAGVDGVLVPRYYGSWAFDMPLLEPSANLLRPVRMILMEWINAVSMWSLIKSGEAYEINPQKRLDLLAKALEVQCKTYFHGVKNLDFALRNILISGLNTPDPSVRLIDFNYSTARKRPGSKAAEETQEERPISPLYYYWRSLGSEFSCWLPRPHRSNKKVCRGWLMSVWGGGKSGEFGGWPEDDEYEDMSEGTYEYAEPLPNDEKHDPRCE